MNEHQKQAAFLKSLMSYGDNEGHSVLFERLSVAERNERCLLCACRLVAVIALMGAAGIGYSAVLLPQFFDNVTHVIVQFFSALALGSFMCLTVFVGLWFWYRRSVNRIHEECRRVITSMLESRFQKPLTSFHPVIVDDANVKVSATRIIAQSSHIELVHLPKAS